VDSGVRLQALTLGSGQTASTEVEGGDRVLPGGRFCSDKGNHQKWHPAAAIVPR
jgi:hypothetical protein